MKIIFVLMISAVSSHAFAGGFCAFAANTLSRWFGSSKEEKRLSDSQKSSYSAPVHSQPAKPAAVIYKPEVTLPILQTQGTAILNRSDQDGIFGYPRMRSAPQEQYDPLFEGGTPGGITSEESNLISDMCNGRGPKAIVIFSSGNYYLVEAARGTYMVGYRIRIMKADAMAEAVAQLPHIAPSLASPQKGSVRETLPKPIDLHQIVRNRGELENGGRIFGYPRWRAMPQRHYFDFGPTDHYGLTSADFAKIYAMCEGQNKEDLLVRGSDGYRLFQPANNDEMVGYKVRFLSFDKVN